MHIKSGIKLLADIPGQGALTKKGDRVLYNWRLYRNTGVEIRLNERQAVSVPTQMLRVVDGYVFVDHQTMLGKRHTMAGVEYTLYGMRPGGYRKVRISPHLAYGDYGLADLIPPHAALIVELWLRAIIAPHQARETEAGRS